MALEAKHFMEKALDLAKKASDCREVPVGALIVCNGEIVSEAFNEKETLNQATAHAEILAIQRASKRLKKWRLSDCDLFVTLEPCPMCAGAIVQSRIRKIYIATKDPKSGACGSILNLIQHPALNHRVEIEYGLFESESTQLLQSFFKNLRTRDKG